MTDEAVLIHGWDPNYYNSNLGKEVPMGEAWSHRQELIDLLGQNFELSYFNLPGFVNIEEPERPFNVEDFTDSFAAWVEKGGHNPKVIIGYSFGGAVALDYKSRYKSPTPTVLVSPAIRRSESTTSDFAHFVGKYVPTILLDTFRSGYQYGFNRYYREGSAFIRSSYNKIVRRDVSDMLLDIDPGGILLIYGTKDQSTPLSLVEDKILQAGLDYIVIPDGAHNIGQTHPQEIADAINSFLHKASEI